MKETQYIEIEGVRYIYHPLDKHGNYIVWLKDKIAQLEKEKKQIDVALVELRQKLQDNENYIPPKD